MQFVSLEPLVEGRPIVDLRVAGDSFDLHNDAILTRFEIEFEVRSVRLSWKAKTPAWKAPYAPEPSQRATEAGLSLILSSVRSVRLAGELFSSLAALSPALDFIEYHRLQGGVGELRLVFDNEAELTVCASRCELRITQA